MIMILVHQNAGGVSFFCLGMLVGYMFKDFINN